MRGTRKRRGNFSHKLKSVWGIDKKKTKNSQFPAERKHALIVLWASPKKCHIVGHGSLENSCAFGFSLHGLEQEELATGKLHKRHVLDRGLNLTIWGRQ